MSDDDNQKVRRLLNLQGLPRKEPKKVWGSRGDGQICAVCGGSIEDFEIQYELEFTEGEPSLSVHGACYRHWHAARERG